MINVALGNLSLINLASDLVFDIMTPQENRQVKIVVYPVFSLHEFLLLLILILCWRWCVIFLGIILACLLLATYDLPLAGVVDKVVVAVFAVEN